MTNSDRLQILYQPYLKPKEVCVLVDRSKPTVRKHLLAAGIEKTDLGYLTDDVIRVFKLQGAIKRWKADAE